MPRARTKAPETAPEAAPDSAQDAPESAAPTAKKSRRSTGAKAPAPAPKPVHVEGVGTIPVGVSHFSIHRQTVDGRDLERVELDAGAEHPGLKLREFPIHALSLENICQLGPGRYQLRYTGTDEATGKRRGLGGSKTIVVQPPPAQPVQAAPQEPAVKLPPGFEQMAAMMQFMETVQARGDARIRAEFERSQQRDREFFALMFRGQAEQNAQVLSLVREASQGARAPAAPAAGVYSKADLELASLKAKFEGLATRERDDDDFIDDEPEPAQPLGIVDQLASALMPSIPGLIEKGVGAYFAAQAAKAAAPPRVVVNPAPAPAPPSAPRPIGNTTPPKAPTDEGDDLDNFDDDELVDDDDEFEDDEQAAE